MAHTVHGWGLYGVEIGQSAGWDTHSTSVLYTQYKILDMQYKQVIINKILKCFIFVCNLKSSSLFENQLSDMKRVIRKLFFNIIMIITFTVNIFFFFFL